MVNRLRVTFCVFTLLLSASAGQAQSFTEGFDDFTTLTPAGWVALNNSSPAGFHSWFQGNSSVFPAQSGAPNSYIADNYSAVMNYGTISDWLLTPPVNFRNGDTLSFYTRTVTGSPYPDRLEVRLSSNGSSTNVGTLPEDVGDFTTLLLEINPTLAVGGYPETWTQYTITISGFPATTNGRFAFRYYVHSGGDNGMNSNYIGLDSLVFLRSWVGSVSITADKNVVAVGRPHIGDEVASYDGFPAGATSAYLPMLFKDAFGGSYDSAFYVQNVDAANMANLTIKFFKTDGTLSCTKQATVAPLASKGYWLPAETCLPADWVGGVVVTSDQPIAAIGRPHIGAEVMTYDGFSSGSTTSYLPMLFKDAFGGSYDSAFYVQNVDATNTATIAIEFYDSAGKRSCPSPKLDTVKPLASKGFWLPAETCLPASWVGGVVVTSDQPIVAVGRPHIGAQITTYNGFSAGANSSYVPMLFKDAFGGSYDSAFYVQNVHTSGTANLNIEYYDTAGTLSCTVNDSVAPLASKGYWVPNQTCLPAGWVGGIVVTSDQPIVAVGRPHIGDQVTTYNGFTSGSLNSYLPMLFNAAFGGSYNSAFYIQNIETDAANVTIAFYDISGALTCTHDMTIPALSTRGLWLPSLTCPP